MTGFELATILCLTPGRVSQLTKTGVLVKTSGSYHLIDSVQAYLKYLRKGKGDPFDPDPVIEKARLLKARRLRLEHELTELRDSYVAAADFEAEMQLFAETIKNALATLPEWLRSDAGLSDSQTFFVKAMIERLCDAVTAE